METIRFLIVIAIALGTSVKATEECHEDQEGCKHLIRKRREIVQGPCIAGSKTPQQASDELKGYEGQFAVNSYNDTSMSKKRQFLTAAKSLIHTVCKNLTVGTAPAQAVSKLAGLHVQRKACNETDSTLSDVPCEGCSGVAKYRITKSLLEKNSHWNCSQDNDICDGVCIGSVRMPKDLISNYSTGCRSHVIHVQTFNPKTAQLVQVSSSGEAMLVEIEFDADGSKTDSSDYKCSVWQHDAGRWDGSFCNLTILPRSSNSKLYVAQCNCTRLGSVCVAFSTTDMNYPLGNSPTTVAPGGSSSTTAPSGGSSGGSGSTTASSGGNSGGSGSTTPSSGGSSGGSGSTTPSSGGSSGDSGSTTASSGGNSGGSGSTTASSGGSSGGGGSTTASSGGSSGGQGTTTARSADTSGAVYASLKLEGDCNNIVGTKNEQPFRTAAKAKLLEALRVRQSQIVDLKVKCGSIILTFFINQLDPSTVQYNISNIGTITTSNFYISLPDGITFKAIQAHVGYASGNVTVYAPPQPTIPPTTAKRYELVFDYTPIMAAIALGIACIVLCVCCTCIIHSWYLRKEKYTEYNSMTIKEYEEKMRAKQQKGMEGNDIPMTDMEPAAPTAQPFPTTNFDMTNEEMPKINERSLTNYDWAHTSYLPGMLARPTDTGMEEAPRLILDEDSDSDSDSEDGQENEGFEKSTLDIPHSASHLSLEKEGIEESNDALSQKNFESPPLYDNVTDSPENIRTPEQQDIYDNVNCENEDDNSNGPPPSPPPRPTEPEYSTIE